MRDWKEICAKCADGEIEPQFCEYYGEPNGCNSPKYHEHPQTETGNEAAMREALVNILKEVSGALEALNIIPENYGYNGLVEDAADALCAIRDDAEEALKKPPRNCDRFETAEEATDAWLELDNSDDGALDPFDWLFAKSEKESEVNG